MQPIDLVQFADHSQKIPSALLSKMLAAEKVPNWALVISHLVEISVAAFMAIIMSGMYLNFHEQFVFGALLKKSSQAGPLSHLSIFLLLLWSQFFFGYFFNHGQSFGLYLIKKRVFMAEKSFRESLRWSLVSTVIAISGGLAIYFLDYRKKIVSQDYLYQDLLSHKDITSQDLVKLTIERGQVQEDIADAA